MHSCYGDDISPLYCCGMILLFAIRCHNVGDLWRARKGLCRGQIQCGAASGSFWWTASIPGKSSAGNEFSTLMRRPFAAFAL
ncbi:hypothetical protein GUJ93_ZPchr0011g27159 [Zizania palustris]|uniref:Uncharacterized protein n=1 Tax=Zizania palustris TaxID=103762 RepID=A0A8J5WHN0_ZIZPA|nr:hypothetical protein GUJ93_ZPchr0011g27159 [Zizania palustris]